MIFIGIKVGRRYYETYGLKKIKIVNQFLFFFYKEKSEISFKKIKDNRHYSATQKQVTLNR